MDGNTTITFGTRLRQLRERAGFTQEGLAERAGITGQAIGALERGDRRRPYANTIHALATALELSAAEEESLARLARRRQINAAFEAPIVRSNRLSVPLTPLYGRSDTTSEVFALLQREDLRLLTMTGPGGVGKTRLAAEVATESISAFPDDVVSVSLVPLNDAGLVLVTIANALGIRETTTRTVHEALRANLASKQMLLVLDNFEHVLGAAGDIADLLIDCPSLKILVTSRAPLRLRGEQEFPVQPLPVPDQSGDNASTDLGSEFASIKLFVARAREVNPSFALSDHNFADVAEICRRLDGLPLAIELAASRTRLFSPEALRSRLTNRLSLLTGGARDLPDRQRTMRDAIAWSYDLCSTTEQTLFRRLAAFAGGASLDAIEDISETLSMHPDVTLDSISNLVHHNLVLQETGNQGGPRFRMLETIREYAMECLEAHEEAGLVWDAHARFFGGLADQMARDEYTARQSQQIMLLEPELDNIRAGLEWLIVRQPFGSERAQAGLKMAGDMVRFWDVRGHLIEEQEWLQRALANAPSEPTAARAFALASLGVTFLLDQDHEESAKWQNQAIAVWREVNEPIGLVRSLWFLGLVEGKRGDFNRMLDLATECEHYIPRLGVTLWNHVPSYLRGFTSLARGDGAAAREHFLPSLSYLQQHGFVWAEMWVIDNLALSALMEGDHASALLYYQQSLAGWQELGDVYGMLDIMLSIATEAIRLGRADLAAQILGAESVTRVKIGARATWKLNSTEEIMAMARQAIGDKSFDSHFATGQQLPLEIAIGLARTLNHSQIQQ